jgi:hypothetical protein
VPVVLTLGEGDITRGGRAILAASKISTALGWPGSGDFIFARPLDLLLLPPNFSRKPFGVVGEGGNAGSGGPVLRRKSTRDSS